MFLSRTLRIIWLLVRFAFELRLSRSRSRKEQLYRRQAIRYRKLASRLGGLPIKVGQFMSTRIDILPKPYTEELAKLQDEVTAVPFDQILPVIEADLGPVKDHFSHFNPEPIGAASLAQVYEARLFEGTEVAVKVLRPKIDKQIRADLKALKLLVGYLARYSSVREQFDFRAVYSDFLQTLGEELDLRVEADHLREFRNNFSTHPKIYIPQIHDDLVSQKVLVMERVYGCKINDLTKLDEMGVEPQQIARTLLDSYIKQVVDFGFFHADPHPGNLLVGPDKRLIFLDFGMMGRIKPEQKPAFKKGLKGLVRNEPPVIVEALVDLGFVLPHADLGAIEEGVRILMTHFSSGGIKALSTQEAMRLMEEMSQFFLDQPIQIPSNFTFLGRSVGILLGLMENLAPEIDIVDLIRQAAGASQEGTKEGLNFIREEIEDWLKTALYLPRSIQNISEALNTGRLKADVDLSQLSQELGRLSRSVARTNRLLLLLSFLALYLLFRG